MNPMKTKRLTFSFILAFPACLFLSVRPGTAQADPELESFRELMEMDWEEVFSDSCTGDWRNAWVLDGEKARVSNGPEGMDFYGGPVPAEDASHSVLWTRESFRGDVKVEYRYTRLDSARRFVNILYLFASGSGAEGYPVDILEWPEKRNVPAMKIYYNHMNLLHISYAAFENTNTRKLNDYIRARRYLTETGKGLEGTELEPGYFRTGLFRTGETSRITVLRKGNDLYMHVRAPGKEKLCHWDLSGFPPVDQGRIGLRHMGSRRARYRDFRIFELERSGD